MGLVISGKSSVDIIFHKKINKKLTVVRIQFKRVFAINFNKWGHHGH